ncbi:hypothetical protein GGR67_003334 [Xanthomonas arboricola]|nr:hypothetical protein [Xanthomonas euroxanthea]
MAQPPAIQKATLCPACSHAHRPSRLVLVRLPSRDLERHGCRARASMDGFTACPATVGGQGLCSQAAKLDALNLTYRTTGKTHAAIQSRSCVVPVQPAQHRGDLVRHGCRLSDFRNGSMACPAMVGRQGPCSQATAPGALHLSYHAPNYRGHMRQLRAAGASRCSPLTISEPAAWIPHKSLERWIRGVSRDRERASALQPGRRSAERSGTLFRGILRGRRADGQGTGHPGAAIEWSPMLGATPGGTAGVPAPQVGQWK